VLCFYYLLRGAYCWRGMLDFSRTYLLTPLSTKEWLWYMCKENRDLHFGEDFLFSYSFNLVTFAFIQLSFSILVLIRTKAMSEGLVFSLISSLTRAWLSRCLFFNLHMFLCILKPIHVVGVIGFNRCWGSRN